MHESNVWDKIFSGKFWGSGGVVFDTVQNRAVHKTIIPIDILKLSGIDVPGDKNDARYAGYTWDTSIRFMDRNIVYREDDDNRPRMFKPNLLQCMNAFLDDEAKEFIMNCFERAHSTMKKYCTGEFIASAMIGSQPGISIPMHIHSTKDNLTFTYFVSSNTSKSNTSVVISVPDKPDIEMQYPDSKEFYGMLDTSLWHGVKTLDGDNNYYIYFVFDGVQLLDANSIELHKFYTV